MVHREEALRWIKQKEGRKWCFRAVKQDESLGEDVKTKSNEERKVAEGKWCKKLVVSPFFHIQPELSLFS